MPRMPLEVYTAGKPALRYRAWVFSILFLLLACLLAAQMTWTRSAKLLASRIAPKGWGISFQPPRGFRRGDPVSTAMGPAIPFQARLSRDVSVEIVFQKTSVKPGTDPTEVCHRVLRSRAGWSLLRLLGPPPPPPSIGRMGDLEAVELHDPAIATLVRAVVLETGLAYSASLSVRGAPIDRFVYRVFDLSCRSVEFAPEDRSPDPARARDPSAQRGSLRAIPRLRTSRTGPP